MIMDNKIKIYIFIWFICTLISILIIQFNDILSFIIPMVLLIVSILVFDYFEHNNEKFNKWFNK